MPAAESVLSVKGAVGERVAGGEVLGAVVRHARER